MSLPPTVHRKNSDGHHLDTTRSDKGKHVSPHAKAKNGTHKKTETHKRPSVLKKSRTLDHSTVNNKTETKKRTSIDTHGKASQTALDTHANEVTKSHGATAVHATRSHIKAPASTETHGKSMSRGRPESHGKNSAYAITKKADVSKTRTNKHNKAEHEKNDRENEDHTESNDGIKTAVSQNSEEPSAKNSDEGN